MDVSFLEFVIVVFLVCFVVSMTFYVIFEIKKLQKKSVHDTEYKFSEKEYNEFYKKYYEVYNNDGSD